jgi:uncharacterized protein (TIGR00730 family)
MRVCVFCGSRRGEQAIYAETAAALGTLLARRGIGVVYGGGNIGLMGVVADAALAAGGEVIGVIPVTCRIARSRTAVSRRCTWSTACMRARR